MAIEHQDTTSDGGSNQLNNVNSIEIVKIDGNVFGIVAGEDNTILVYEIDSDPNSPTYGEMSDTPVESVSDNGSTFFNKGMGLETVEVDGTTVLFAGGDDGGITSFTMDSAGQLTQVQNFADTGSTNLQKVQAMTSLTVDDGAGGTNTFLFTGDEGDAGVSVFEVNSDGTFTNVDNVNDGDDGAYNLKKIFGMDSVQVDDGVGGTNSFVIAGSKDDNGLSVFQVGSDGTLTNVDNVNDDGTTFIKDVFAVETHVIDGTAYVFAGGNDNGLSVFEVGSDGTLTNRGNLADDGSLNLENIRDIHVDDHLGTPTMWVGGDAQGLDVYEISVDGSGNVSFTRVEEYDESSFDTGNIRAMGGGEGYVIAANDGSHTASSFTAPCFAPGTLILTPDGERPVEDLRVGDLVTTADRGAQPLRWVGRREVVFGSPQVDTQKPIEIKAGALAPGLPRRTLVVSPQHRMVLIDQDGAEVLGLAKGLTGLEHVRRMDGKREVVYHALLFDRHEIIFAEGAATESFRPGPYILSLFPPALRAEIFAVVPRLADDPGWALGPPARPILKRREVEAMVGGQPRWRPIRGAGSARAPAAACRENA